MAFRHLGKHWFAWEATPLYVVMGGAIAGCSWYVYRLSQGPDVRWSPSNPEPWNNIKQGQQVKLLAVNQEYPGGRWNRRAKKEDEGH